MKLRKSRQGAKPGKAEAPDIGLLRAKMAALRAAPDAGRYQKMMQAINAFKERIEKADTDQVDGIVREMRGYFERLKSEDPALYEASEIHRKTMAEGIMRKFGFVIRIN
jgi:hypothetical protein